MRRVISAVRERFQKGRRVSPAIPVPLGSGRDDEVLTLRALLQGTQWMPIQVTNWSSMFKLATLVDAPVFLCDRDLPGLEWQEGVPRLVRASSTSCLILLSDVSDPYLWDELVQHGGFDVLTRPFQRKQVLAMLDFAYTHWKTRWPSRPNGHFEALA
jgi:FixJ family two-component response regulator